MKEVEWDERYRVGVAVIDSAHQKLFVIVRRLVLLSENEQRSRWACEESVKYLKSYTLRHFAEEEAYMRQIGYDGYEVHKKIHDDMREVQLPTYEKELVATGFSSEAVQHFVGFCIGWLTGHIMMEDRKITKEKTNTFTPPDRLKDVESFAEEVASVLKDLFALQVKIANMHYEVDEFGSGIYYCLVYRSERGERFLVTFLLNEQLVPRTVSEMPGIPFDKIDNIVLYATRQIARYLLEYIGGHFQRTGRFQLEKEALLDEKQFLQGMNVANPYCSIRFETQYGPFALCVNR